MEDYGFKKKNKHNEARNIITQLLEKMVVKEDKCCFLPRVRSCFKNIVEDNKFELAIQIIIIINSLTLGCEYYG